jgi:hypothetical protein
LSGKGSPKCVRRDGKGRAEGIPNGLENIAAMRLNFPPQDFIMTCQGELHFFGMLFPKPGAAFDISEKESDSASGWRGGHSFIPANARVI